MEIKNRTYRKARRIAKGTLEGIVYTFIAPTYFRLDREYKVGGNFYQDSGHFIGLLANLSSHLGAYILSDDLRVAIPLVATNIISFGYEKVRKYLKNRS